MLLVLTACNQISLPDAQDTFQNDDVDSDPGDSVDLSAYDDHGDWSCNRMWVHKTDSGYDHSEGYYAYIDDTGNLITDWWPDDIWIRPFDYDDGTALVYTGIERAEEIGGVVPVSCYQPVSYVILDLDGREISLFTASAYYEYWSEGDGDTWANVDPHSTDTKLYRYQFNDYGLLFYDKVYDEKFAYPYYEHHVIFKDGTDITFEPYTKEFSSGSVYNIERHSATMDSNGFKENFENGYIVFWDIASSGYIILIYNENGEIVADLSDFSYPVQDVSNVSEDGTVDITFRGKDSNYYVVTVNMDGEWLNEPVKQ
jgi:hypothetical protein